MNSSSSKSDTQRCGFVSVIGLPNAGKSTLVNALVGQKISIVSEKVQTTRARVLGMLVHGQAQIILMDTPGIFDAQKTIERAMVGAAYDALDESDVIVHLVDVSFKKPMELNKDLIARLPEHKQVILVLNKIDQIKKPALLHLAQELNAAHDYAATFMVSALKKEGIGALPEVLAGYMPESNWLFDEDQVTDMPMRILAAEITREKIFNRLYQELPTSTFVETETWEEFENGSLKITQLIYVQRNSQKAIILGKGGQQIKQIGQESRSELEDMLGRSVHLKLFVKVKENWAEQPEFLRLMGL